MPSLYNNYAKGRDLNWVAEDIRALLVDSTTTVDVEPNATSLSNFTTLGELFGTGYSRKSLTGKAVTIDTANNRAEFDTDDITWANIQAGTSVGMLLFRYVDGTPANDLPIAFVEFATPIITNSGDITIIIDITGLLQRT